MSSVHHALESVTVAVSAMDGSRPVSAIISSLEFGMGRDRASRPASSAPHYVLMPLSPVGVACRWEGCDLNSEVEVSSTTGCKTLEYSEALLYAPSSRRRKII
jgi:hypothetical protein